MLACGVDVAYPPANSMLFDALARENLLVSELAPGVHPARVRFLARNRLIAAMSGGTIVVEAALRSGARNTAGWAMECGRPLMAVPGPIHSRASTAPHLMIRSGQAVLVTSAAEVLELISSSGQHTLPLVHGPQRATDTLTEFQLAVYEAIPARRRASVGDIALVAGVERSGLPRRVVGAGGRRHGRGRRTGLARRVGWTPICGFAVIQPIRVGRVSAQPELSPTGLPPAYPARAAWGTATSLRAWQQAALDAYFATAPRDYLAVATPGAGKTTFALTWR